ncbi:hypothetical protein [Sphingorhabdus sp.]|uniref:hypothetical protein n=1 Tax=Sphingorhabdus sp. TaxID=1902408 RepID=UPI003D819DC8
MTTNISAAVSPSVMNLWHEAQISHHSIARPEIIEEAIRSGAGTKDAQEAIALAIQESSTWDLIDLLVDKVINGPSLHALLRNLQMQGAIRRPDLLKWAEIFT